jgi:hypothetical protein
MHVVHLRPPLGAWICAALASVYLAFSCSVVLAAEPYAEVFFGDGATYTTGFTLCTNVRTTIIKPPAGTYAYIGWLEVRASGNGSGSAGRDLRVNRYVSSTAGADHSAYYQDGTYFISGIDNSGVHTYKLDESPDDYMQTAWLMDGEYEYHFEFVDSWSPTCGTYGHAVYGSVTDILSEEYDLSNPAQDGIQLIGYGEGTWPSWETWTTSTDPYGFFEPYASSSYGFIDPDFGWFGNAVMDVLKYLFVGPLTSINNWFQLQLQNARYRWPQGYIVRIQEAWENSLTDSFTSSSSTPLTVDLMGKTYTVWSANPKEDTGIDTDEWRIYSTYVFYIMAMWYFWGRVREFVDDLGI